MSSFSIVLFVLYKSVSTPGHASNQPVIFQITGDVRIYFCWKSYPRQQIWNSNFYLRLIITSVALNSAKAGIPFLKFISSQPCLVIIEMIRCPPTSIATSANKPS